MTAAYDVVFLLDAAVAAYPVADLTIERIGDLLDADMGSLLALQDS